MKLRTLPAMLATLVSLNTAAFAGTPANVQATPIPFGLPLAGQVQVSGSDARAKTFNDVWLPKFRQIINDNLSESVRLENVSGFKLDSEKLFLRMQARETIRVYFVAEGAGYQNTLGFSFTPAGQKTPGTPHAIFPNGSVGTAKNRSVNEPLRVGDFVEIGRGGNGWQLDFFLISDGFKRWKDGLRNANQFNWFWNDVEKNPDDLIHVVAFALPDCPYILIGFEDLFNGGDRDYNDMLFVVDIGLENTEPLFDNPSSLPN
jgi:hypothetical protein